MPTTVSKASLVVEVSSKTVEQIRHHSQPPHLAACSPLRSPCDFTACGCVKCRTPVLRCCWANTRVPASCIAHGSHGRRIAAATDGPSGGGWQYPAMMGEKTTPSNSGQRSLVSSTASSLPHPPNDCVRSELHWRVSLLDKLPTVGPSSLQKGSRTSSSPVCVCQQLGQEALMVVVLGTAAGAEMAVTTTADAATSESKAADRSSKDAGATVVATSGPARGTQRLFSWVVSDRGLGSPALVRKRRTRHTKDGCTCAGSRFLHG